MSGGRKALEAAPVGWRILQDEAWFNCYDPEIASKARQCGYAVVSLYTRDQLQAAYDEGVRAGHSHLTSWRAEGGE